MKQAAWKARIKEVFMQEVFFIAACASILAVILICVFLFANGLPAIGKIGPMEFLLGTRWKPGNNIFGILPFILGSIYVTAGAILIGVPIGILCAVFMARFCPKKIYPILKPAIISVALFQFMWSMNDFIGPLIYVYSVDKYPIALALKMSIDVTEGAPWNEILAMASISILPSIIVFFLAQRYFVQGVTSSGIKG